MRGPPSCFRICSANGSRPFSLAAEARVFASAEGLVEVFHFLERTRASHRLFNFSCEFALFANEAQDPLLCGFLGPWVRGAQKGP